MVVPVAGVKLRERIAEAEQHLSQSDPRMARLIARHSPCTLGSGKRDPFHVLCASIIGQQLSGKAADTIQARVEALVGAKGRFHPTHFVAAKPEQLRACGLSNAKAKWLQAAATRIESGQFSFRALARMDDAAAGAALDELPGIGPWTAEMMLIFALNRADIFSLGDAGLRRAINLVYNDGRKLNDTRTLKLARTWAPYRSVASWYLWRVADGDLTSWA